jgi:fatty acid desaturase
MTAITKLRDYSIIGEPNQKAKEQGLVQAEWYTSPVPRSRMKEFMKRKDGPAIRDTLIWFGLLFAAGYWGYVAWGTWWAVPAFALYGMLYSSVSNSRWHECGHGTAFKTPWMNEVVYQIASFMSMMQATPWRWSHSRHHTDTIIVGSDTEILYQRPPVWKMIVLNFLRYSAPKAVRAVFRRAMGKLTAEEKSYIEETAFSKVIWEARAYAFILISVVVWCISVQSLLPAMYIGLPIIYGAYLSSLFGLVQHAGLYENVLDHRLNSRTFYTNSIVRFLYWNMNYHVEHHMFPMVPYHALPALHEEIKSDCPPACPSFPAAIRESFYALWKQRKDPDFTLDRILPETAQPFKF